MKFLRTGSRDILRLGKKRKKTQKWRKARGRDNKIREKVKGHPKKVEIGYRTEKAKRHMIKNKKIILIKNINDANKADKNQIAIISKVGKKKRIEIEKILNQNKVEISNKKNETKP
jgi:large subunit ribosomal protein L32e